MIVYRIKMWYYLGVEIKFAKKNIVYSGKILESNIKWYIIDNKELGGNYGRKWSD